MDYYLMQLNKLEKELNSNLDKGLTVESVKTNREKYGLNVLSAKKKTGIIKKIFNALKEPMMIILLISFCIALFSNLSKYIRTGEGDFFECIGILLAVVLSVSITLIMEGSSQKAFSVLNKLYDNIYVKAIRDGQTVVVNQDDVCVGDVLILESGDKIVADGRLILDNSLVVDESALTGESNTVNKSAIELGSKVSLAERVNMVYSGTFVTGGSGKMIVTGVGNNTEIGKIAGQLSINKEVLSPLQQKLARLGKNVSLIGTVTAILVFIISIVRLAVTKTLTFSSVQELFVSCIILVVAAVPEGLPTIVAVSLALNMIKLAKENALIKKMIATETAGAVSVICTDKTGTLTTNKMNLISICTGEYCTNKHKAYTKEILQNFICNSTADVYKRNKEYVYQGSGTECALIVGAINSNKGFDYKAYRKSFPEISRTPFSSQTKLMTTVIEDNGVVRELVKGAPETVLKLVNLTKEQKNKILLNMQTHQDKARRVLCFVHKDNDSEYVYDGFAVLEDEIRKDVFSAVEQCKKAGIEIKILTGDNVNTAFAVGKQLKISNSAKEVINGQELENLNEKELIVALKKIKIIARSTPMLKLKIVKALKTAGEVVAVTGDGINDAPAIKHADVGFAMGKAGSEITKESADVVLLDDSFSTIVRAISFGRNVFRNLQRFILFQLSVNVSALLLVTVCALIGLPSPFNTLQLLWINVIMDGPPALTLGLEKSSGRLMNFKPVKRQSSIVSMTMLYRIIFNGVLVAFVILMQYLTNFLGLLESEKSGGIFTLFILFQLFNAFNSREFGSDSIFKSIGKNKIMLITFAFTFLIQILIVQFAYNFFMIAPLSLLAWVKIIVTAFSIIVISEIYKLAYRKISLKKKFGFNK